MCRNPVVGIRQFNTRFVERGANSRVDERCCLIRVQTLEAGKELPDLQKCAWAGLGQKLAIQKLADDMPTDQRRIWPKSRVCSDEAACPGSPESAVHVGNDGLPIERLCTLHSLGRRPRRRE